MEYSEWKWYKSIDVQCFANVFDPLIDTSKDNELNIGDFGGSYDCFEFVQITNNLQILIIMMFE